MNQVGRHLDDIFTGIEDRPAKKSSRKNSPSRSPWLSLTVGTIIFLYDVFKTVTTVLGIAFLIRFFLIQPFYISGASMEPTFQNNQYIIVDQISPKFTTYRRGEVVVFRYPNNVAFQYIKRVMALPGEEVEIKEGKVYLYNQNHPQGAALAEQYVKGITIPHFQSTVRFEVEENEYFVLGDNRQHSEDSRDFGPIKKELIIGRVWIRLYPFSDFAVIGRPLYGQGL